MKTKNENGDKQESYIKQGFIVTEEIFELHQELAGDFAWLITRASAHNETAHHNDIAKVRKTLFKLYFLIANELEEPTNEKDKFDIISDTKTYEQLKTFIPKFLKNDVFGEVLDIKNVSFDIDKEINGIF